MPHPFPNLSPRPFPLPFSLCTRLHSRASPEVQARFEAAETDTSLRCWMDVASEVQREVLLDAGVPPHDVTRALALMRAAPYRHPELQPLCVYHRATRISKQGSCRQGDTLPPMPLLRLVAAAGSGGGAGGEAGGPVLQEVGGWRMERQGQSWRVTAREPATSGCGCTGHGGGHTGTPVWYGRCPTPLRRRPPQKLPPALAPLLPSPAPASETPPRVPIPPAPWSPPCSLEVGL